MAKAFPFLLGVLVTLTAVIAACGFARSAGNAYAVSISGPEGVSCYAIIGGQGEAVGGNCLPR